MATGIPKSYTRSTLQKMQESRAKLKLQQGLLSTDNPDELPNFEVWKYTSSDRLDKPYGNQPRYLTGTSQLVAVQASAIKALHDELALRLGFGATFEEWFEQWEKGYPSLINRAGNDLSLKTNFPIRSTNDRSGWRENVESRPKYLEWKHPKENRKFRTIEYFPEGRANPGKSIVLSGSDAQIIQGILNYTWGTSNFSIEGGEVFEGGWHHSRTGQPEVLLTFWEDKQDVAEGYDKVRGTIRFRIMDKTDDPDSSMEKLTWNDIRQLQQKIYQIFVTPNDGEGFIWKKGKEKVTYYDRNAGHDLRILSRNETEGYKVIDAVLAVQNQQRKLDCQKVNLSPNPEVAYPTIPPIKNVLGKPQRLPRLRPVADVRFTRASLLLQYHKGPIPLINDRQLMAIAGD